MTMSENGRVDWQVNRELCLLTQLSPHPKGPDPFLVENHSLRLGCGDSPPSLFILSCNLPQSLNNGPVCPFVRMLSRPTDSPTRSHRTPLRPYFIASRTAWALASLVCQYLTTASGVLQASFRLMASFPLSCTRYRDWQTGSKLQCQQWRLTTECTSPQSPHPPWESGRGSPGGGSLLRAQPLTDRHSTCGSNRSVQLPPRPTDPTHHLVVMG